jgi:DNA-binding NarL/FixJ family response regulator
VEQAQYCDKALLMFKNALMDEQPFDLVITDLSLKTNGDSTRTINGEALLREVYALQPEVKSIIYSIEDRPFKIQQYLESLKVDAYVLKGRNSRLQMVEAIQAIQEDDRYLSPELSEKLHQTSDLDIDKYDLLLLKSLSEGYSQQEISKRFKKQAITPHSLSSIEKRVNRLKESLSARNIPNLIALSKDMGLI